MRLIALLDLLKERYPEGGRLARSGLGLRHDVPAGHEQWDGL
jgi:hypothetical protein